MCGSKVYSETFICPAGVAERTLKTPFVSVIPTEPSPGLVSQGHLKFLAHINILIARGSYYYVYHLCGDVCSTCLFICYRFNNKVYIYTVVPNLFRFMYNSLMFHKRFYDGPLQ